MGTGAPVPAELRNRSIPLREHGPRPLTQRQRRAARDVSAGQPLSSHGVTRQTSPNDARRQSVRDRRHGYLGDRAVLFKAT